MLGLVARALHPGLARRGHRADGPDDGAARGRRLGARGRVLRRAQRRRRRAVHAVDVGVAGSLSQASCVRRRRTPISSRSRAGPRSSAGSSGSALTFVYTEVLEALTGFYSVLVVSLFAPILGGLVPAARRPLGRAGRDALGITTLAVTSPRHRRRRLRLGRAALSRSRRERRHVFDFRRVLRPVSSRCINFATLSVIARDTRV